MTLEMRDQENIELGREIGRVMGMLSLLRESNVSDDNIYRMIQKKYDLSIEEVEHYMGMGVVHMYEMLWLHDPEKMKNGLEIGMLSLWSSLSDLNLDRDIIQKIQEEYNLSQEEVEHYMKMNV